MSSNKFKSKKMFKSREKVESRKSSRSKKKTESKKRYDLMKRSGPRSISHSWKRSRSQRNDLKRRPESRKRRILDRS